MLQTMKRFHMERPQLTKSERNCAKEVGFEHGLYDRSKTHVTSKLRIGKEVQQKQEGCCATRRRFKRRLRLESSVHRGRIFRVAHDSRLFFGCDFQTSRMRRRSERCNIGLQSSEMAPQSWRLLESECPTIWIRPLGSR